MVCFLGTQKGSTKLRGTANMEICPYSRNNWKKLLKNLLSTALAKHHANGDTSVVTEIVNLCPIM